MQVFYTSRTILGWTTLLFSLMYFLPVYAGIKAVDSELAEIERGEYLTTILSCGGCHTQGALLGEQTGAWLAGSKIGIAYAEDESGSPSAVIFPSNLTSDNATGLGSRTQQEIIDLLRSGTKHTGEPVNAVMPWINYQLLKDEDIVSIAAYIKSLPASKNVIPKHILPGQPITEPYLRFSIYYFVPDQKQSPLLHKSNTNMTNCGATPC
ncbi:MAG: mono/diheme cytochrome c family protein [Limisphaerales bacterium]|jgi:hypothetical protein